MAKRKYDYPERDEFEKRANNLVKRFSQKGIDETMLYHTLKLLGLRKTRHKKPKRTGKEKCYFCHERIKKNQKLIWHHPNGKLSKELKPCHEDCHITYHKNEQK